MSYAPPAWLPEKENPNGIILLLDDFTRNQCARVKLRESGKLFEERQP